MLTRIAVFLTTVIWVGTALAQGAGDAAQLARDQLEAASVSLAKARSTSDRVAALTETVRAYEAGLSAMRAGLREAELQQRRITQRVEGEKANLSALLSTLIVIQGAPDAETLLHPEGALPSARAGLLIADAVPDLQARVRQLSVSLRELQTLKVLQEAGLETLSEGLTGARAARLELSNAVSDRIELPPPVATDEAAIEALINSTETLGAFADALAGAVEPTLTRLPPPWEMPVNGQLLRRFNEADAAGVRRAGWVIATSQQALVTSPVPATVRFAGLLSGHGQVVILEPASTQLLILAGLDETFVHRDQIVSEGDPIGWMSAERPREQENLIETSSLGGQPASETLYMEVRQIEKPVDPAIYFAPGQNEG